MKSIWQRLYKALRRVAAIRPQCRSPRLRWLAARSRERYRRRPDAVTDAELRAALLPGEIGTFRGITIHTGPPMNAQQFAGLLNGIKYPVRIHRDLEQQAKAAGLVIVFGASDDLMEFRGAINDEIGAYEGATAYVDAKGLLQDFDDIDKDDRDAMKDFFAREAGAKPIVAQWSQGGYSWTYQTDIPHSTFEVLEDGEPEPYCRGIVFALADLASGEQEPAFTFFGETAEIGVLEDGLGSGLVLRAADGQEISVVGFTEDQIRKTKDLAFDPVILRIGRQ